ncbi:hypothetical protein J5J86_03990 [Aquabacter sp. L1I39]|uniref:hypothetical protein n=1 Tax=Aquabacter sp. L1I39 TaxID=2820278 RepID=UPI001ADBB0BB|nr:hypothetical protein [Aquabacter sp. L1I39]QTL04510.1 hypothetical protein J5J86_03990 [Aquabacter sp. L1I39]
MTRTTVGLITLFALIAAVCVAFGAYFSFITLQNAHRQAVEARFTITAERIAQTAQVADALGIALPMQETLTGVLRREERLDDAIRSIDVVDRRGHVLFSSAPDRVGVTEPRRIADSVAAGIENDLAAVIGQVVVRYDPHALATGAAALSEDLSRIAVPTLLGAGLATLVIGLLLAFGLKRAVRRAADPGSWPPAAVSARAAADAAHATLIAPEVSGS